MTIFEKVTLSLAVLTLCIFAAQFWEMKKSTDAATKAANAAEASVREARDSAHLDQRAWVSTIEIRGNFPEADKEFHAPIKFKNSGKTFAKNVKVNWHIRTLPKQQAPNFDKDASAAGETTRSVGLLPPNGDSTIDTLSEAPDQTGVNNIKSGGYRVFVFGEITYKDIFDCPHWTNFCYVLRTTGTYEIWEAHNDADDNRR